MKLATSDIFITNSEIVDEYLDILIYQVPCREIWQRIFHICQADLSIDIEDVTIRQLKILKTFLCFHGSEFFHMTS